MDTPSPFSLAAAVLTAPSERVREQAALELAERIMAQLEKPPVVVPDG